MCSLLVPNALIVLAISALVVLFLISGHMSVKSVPTIVRSVPSVENATNVKIGMASINLMNVNCVMIHFV